jgi:hypothetical protein
MSFSHAICGVTASVKIQYCLNPRMIIRPTWMLIPSTGTKRPTPNPRNARRLVLVPGATPIIQTPARSILIAQLLAITW